MNKKSKSYINIILTVIVIAISVAWMITFVSQGEITQYKRKLVITTLEIDVKLYEYIDSEDEFVEVTAQDLDVSNIAPGDVRQYKFEIKNYGTQVAKTHIVLSDITGDIDVLGPKLTFATTSPIVNEFILSDNIQTLSNGDKAMNFTKNISIEPNDTYTLYWHISLDYKASNEVAGKELKIGSINFLKP